MNRRRSPSYADPATQTATLSWLGQDGRGASLLGTARRLMALQQHLDAALPDGLRGSCRVLKLDDGNLLLGVRAAPHSAKLRQMAPRIAAALQSQGWQINGIAVRVQASLLRPPGWEDPTAAGRPRAGTPLSERGIEAFEHLHGTLRAGPLADAVGRLLARRR